MTEIEEQLNEYLVSTAARILRCSQDQVSWQDDIDEYGFASMEVNMLCATLNDYFRIDTNPTVFLQITSLEAFSRHLLDTYPGQIESRLS